MAIYVSKTNKQFYELAEDYELNEILVNDLNHDNVWFSGLQGFENEDQTQLWNYLETLPFGALIEITNYWNNKHSCHQESITERLTEYIGSKEESITTADRRAFIDDYFTEYFKPDFYEVFGYYDLDDILCIAKKYDGKLSFARVCGGCQGEVTTVWTTNTHYNFNENEKQREYAENAFYAPWYSIDELDENGDNLPIDEIDYYNVEEYMKDQYNAVPADEATTERVENGTYQVITEWK